MHCEEMLKLFTPFIKMAIKLYHKISPDIFTLVKHLRKIFDSYLNNGAMTLIFSDVFGNLCIKYLAKYFFKNLTQNLHR